jgi:hypothetical protein
MQIVKSYLLEKKKLGLMFKWFLMYLFSRFTSFRYVMKLISKNHRVQVEARSENSVAIFQNLNVDNIVTSLKTDGFSLPLHLPKDVLGEILEFAKKSYLHGNGNRQLGFSYQEKEKAEARNGNPFIIGNYESASLCPVINKIAQDPKLIEIATKYLGQKPICRGSRLWWSFPVEATTDEIIKVGKVFHYDLDDYNSLNFFFYLTDVDLHSGPHVCIRGSHKKKKLTHQLSLVRRRSDEEMLNYYGAENIVTIYGEAGTGIAEDPFCFHKGTLPHSKERLMLQIGFSINSY